MRNPQPNPKDQAELRRLRAKVDGARGIGLINTPDVLYFGRPGDGGLGASMIPDGFPAVVVCSDDDGNDAPDTPVYFVSVARCANDANDPPTAKTKVEAIPVDQPGHKVVAATDWFQTNGTVPASRKVPPGTPVRVWWVLDGAVPPNRRYYFLVGDEKANGDTCDKSDSSSSSSDSSYSRGSDSIPSHSLDLPDQFYCVQAFVCRYNCDAGGWGPVTYSGASCLKIANIPGGGNWYQPSPHLDPTLWQKNVRPGVPCPGPEQTAGCPIPNNAAVPAQPDFPFDCSSSSSSSSASTTPGDSLPSLPSVGTSGSSGTGGSGLCNCPTRDFEIVTGVSCVDGVTTVTKTTITVYAPPA